MGLDWIESSEELSEEVGENRCDRRDFGMLCMTQCVNCELVYNSISV